MPILLSGTELPAAPLEQRSRCLAHWRASDLSVDMPLCGLAGTFTRGTTLVVSDRNGTDYTTVNAQPGWEWRDLNADSDRETVGLYMTGNDRISWPVLWRRQAFAFRLEFVECGAINTPTYANLLSINADGNANGYLDIYAEAAGYVIRFNNGVGGFSAVGLATEPSVGQHVVLRGQLYSDGSVQLWQSINGAAETATARTSAPSGGMGSGVLGGASSRLRLNYGPNAAGGLSWYRSLKIVAGLPDLAYLNRVF